MPVLGNDNAPARTADALEDLLEKLDELIANSRQVPTVNIPPPPAQEPPIVNVEAPPRPKAWKFKVTARDAAGLIETITAKPIF